MPGEPLRGFDVIGAAHRRQWMKMQRVHRAARHDVDPAIGHRQRPLFHVPFDGAGERCDVARELALQHLERGRDALQPMDGTVGGVAAGVVFGGPAPAGRIVQAQLPALFQELPIEFPRPAPLQRSAVDQRWEVFANRHVGAGPKAGYRDSLTSLNWMMGATSVYLGISAVNSAAAGFHASRNASMLS